VVVEVDKATQTMRVTVDGELRYVWLVSTTKQGAVTPTGTFAPQWLSKHHRSSKYKWAPMPNAVFYSGDYAIHGTLEENVIGRPASRGCVRLTVAHSSIFYELVRQYGIAHVRIIIT
jgi:lipoprotein-anchoring transpeptidase ErfK/SrfK